METVTITVVREETLEGAIRVQERSDILPTDRVFFEILDETYVQGGPSFRRTGKFKEYRTARLLADPRLNDKGFRSRHNFHIIRDAIL